MEQNYYEPPPEPFQKVTRRPVKGVKYSQHHLHFIATFDLIRNVLTCAKCGVMGKYVRNGLVNNEVRIRCNQKITPPGHAARACSKQLGEKALTQLYLEYENKSRDYNADITEHCYDYTEADHIRCKNKFFTENPLTYLAKEMNVYPASYFPSSTSVLDDINEFVENNPGPTETSRNNKNRVHDANSAAEPASVSSSDSENIFDVGQDERTSTLGNAKTIALLESIIVSIRDELKLQKLQAHQLHNAQRAIHERLDGLLKLLPAKLHEPSCEFPDNGQLSTNQKPKVSSQLETTKSTSIDLTNHQSTTPTTRPSHAAASQKTRQPAYQMQQIEKMTGEEEISEFLRMQPKRRELTLIHVTPVRRLPKNTIRQAFRKLGIDTTNLLSISYIGHNALEICLFDDYVAKLDIILARVKINIEINPDLANPVYYTNERYKNMDKEELRTIARNGAVSRLKFLAEHSTSKTLRGFFERMSRDVSKGQLQPYTINQLTHSNEPPSNMSTDTTIDFNSDNSITSDSPGENQVHGQTNVISNAVPDTLCEAFKILSNSGTPKNPKSPKSNETTMSDEEGISVLTSLSTFVHSPTQNLTTQTEEYIDHHTREQLTPPPRKKFRSMSIPRSRDSPRDHHLLL